ncbi:MAG: UDP-2,3-diacylglucosamine diphosphatase [Halobacteriovoraceae bacterium]|nr:UDP-2,3-diacylglucosamine diphosphatase [Halobacteriovoraceae bacterium]
MSWAFISDVHIKFPGDENQRIIKAFFDKSEELGAEKIFLLGDIFDLMIGEKTEYLEHYHQFFTDLAASSAKEIHFFEGNHDFHLRKVWENIKKFYPAIPPVFYHENGLVMEKGGKRIWISHGDDIEIGNPKYKVLRFIVRSFPAKFIGNLRFITFNRIKLIAFCIHKLQKLVDKVFGKSSKLKEMDLIKSRFRESAVKIANRENAEIVVIGHSHVKDFVDLQNCVYINNGYVPKSKCCSVIDEEGKVKQISLS